VPQVGFESTTRCLDGSVKQIATTNMNVGNQQKWDTFVKERSGGNGGVVGLPQQAVVAFAAS